MKVHFDPTNFEDRREVRNLLDFYDREDEADAQRRKGRDVIATGKHPHQLTDEERRILREGLSAKDIQSVEEIAATSTGQRLLVPLARNVNFGDYFTITDMASTVGMEPQQVHSLIAGLGRAEKRRKIKIFNDHGMSSSPTRGLGNGQRVYSFSKEIQMAILDA